MADSLTKKDPADGSILDKRPTADDDDAKLHDIGLESSGLERNFNTWSLLFMSFCTSVTWEAVSSASAQALTSGGSSSLVWGFVATAVGTMLIALCLAEYSGMIPTAGGQYHYVAKLAPPKYRRIFAWFAGWITMLGWVTCSLAGTFATAMQIQAWAILFSDTYVYERWHTSLIAWSIGLLTSAVSFVGWDSSTHMAEEMTNAAQNLPRTMIANIAVSGLATFPWVIAVAFCFVDLQGVLSGPVGRISPFVQLYYNISGGNQAATIGLTSFLPIISFCGTGTSVISATSRIIWSFARDGGLPAYFSHIDEKTKVPVRSIVLTWGLISALSLIYIGNATAYYGISSATTVALVISYAFPIFINVVWGFKGPRMMPATCGIERRIIRS
ncbi:hypothetical protein N0V84_008812 [Fusarium piperis]|uniref:Amino acid transporter n=1 Tax=Fusarium piperis TaxID=1435070 RepID=A0A9W8W7F3_9HYPO|nr:hypothetical protein N0V84_008812 [Fusarium piperis]